MSKNKGLGLVSALAVGAGVAAVAARCALCDSSDYIFCDIH